jgi:hypothetical protein
MIGSPTAGVMLNPQGVPVQHGEGHYGVGVAPAGDPFDWPSGDVLTEAAKKALHGVTEPSQTDTDRPDIGT